MALATDTLKYLSSTHRSEFQNRKKLEWRVLFAVTTSFAVAAAGVWSSNTTLDQGSIGKMPTVLVWIAFIIIALLTCVLLYCLHLAHEINKAAAHKTELHLQAIYNHISNLKSDPLTPLDMLSDRSKIFHFENPAKSLKTGPWGLIWECAIIILTAMICAYLIGLKLKAPSLKTNPNNSISTTVHALF